MEESEILDYLKTLSDTYGALKGPPLTVVLCGGAALLALELIDRTTKDVDILGPPKLPQQFWQAAKITAQYFQLPNDWINQGPADLWNSGLPERFQERCTPLELDQTTSPLKFLITSRFDQIHFKLYAAVDQGPSRHVQDLAYLKPTTDELMTAANWCLTQDVSEEFRRTLIDMLIQQGWKHVASKLA